MFFSQICGLLTFAIVLVNTAPLANKDVSNVRRQVASPDSNIEFDPTEIGPDYSAYGQTRPNKRNAYTGSPKRNQESTDTYALVPYVLNEKIKKRAAELKDRYAEIPPYGVLVRDGGEEFEPDLGIPSVKAVYEEEKREIDGTGASE